MWEIWTNLAEDNAPNLKYIFKHHIITASTQYIMEQAAGVGHNALDEDWPGLVYFPDDIEFLALLGTPHGKVGLLSAFLPFKGCVSMIYYLKNMF